MFNSALGAWLALGVFPWYVTYCISMFCYCRFSAADGSEKVSITYVPSHLYHMLFELYKVSPDLCVLYVQDQSRDSSRLVCTLLDRLRLVCTLLDRLRLVCTLRHRVKVDQQPPGCRISDQ